MGLTFWGRRTGGVLWVRCWTTGLKVSDFRLTRSSGGRERLVEKHVFFYPHFDKEIHVAMQISSGSRYTIGVCLPYHKLFPLPQLR